MTQADNLIYDKPGHLIRRLQQIAVAIFMNETKAFDITPVQYAALLAIDLYPGVDQTALVNIIAFDRSTIGDVVERLIAKGLARRARSRGSPSARAVSRH
jgi:DNA-binding MarR family transcriptional regulator